MLARTDKELQTMLDSLVSVGRNYGMEINTAKSKVMRISKSNVPLNVNVGGSLLEDVSHFKYLGSTLTYDGTSTQEIRERIGMAKAAFYDKINLLEGKLDLQLRKQMLKCYVWSVALYGAETWTLRKQERTYLESFEMWCWRKMEKIIWSDRITNEEVLRRVDEKRTIIKEVTKRKANWVGHILRRNGLMLDIIEGKMDAPKKMGRRRIGTLDLLKRGRDYPDLKDLATDRQRWRKEYQ